MITKIKINGKLENCMDLERLAQKYRLEFEYIENNEYEVSGACENVRNEFLHSDDVLSVCVENADDE